MSLRYPVLVLAALSVLSCGRTDSDSAPSVSDEWRHVLAVKKKVVAGDPVTRQAYIAEVHDFVRRHPDHRRAREVWEELEIEYAYALSGSGRGAEAVQRLERLLAGSPIHRKRLQDTHDEIADKVRVTPEELQSITRGMTQARVREILGPPRRGWSRRTPPSSESWFYRVDSGRTGAIHFHKGRVLSTEITG